MKKLTQYFVVALLVAICSSVQAQQQNTLIVSGTVNNCYPGQWVQSALNFTELPAVFVDPLDCTYSFTITTQDTSGRVYLQTLCGPLLWENRNFSFTGPLDTIFLNVDLYCGQSALDCNGVSGGPAVFGTPCDDGDPNTFNDRWQNNCWCQGSAVGQCTVSAQNLQVMDGGVPVPWQLWFPAVSTGVEPFSEGTLNVDGVDIVTGTGSELTYTFTEAGVHNWSVRITDALGCTSYGGNPDVRIDCAGYIEGPYRPGTLCDDGNPNTTNDTWSAECECIGTTIPQYPVTISGVISPCNPGGGFVTITSLPNTIPIVDIDVFLDSTCTYTTTVFMDSPQGGFLVSANCSGAVVSEMGTYQVNVFDTANVVINLNCNANPDTCTACFNVSQSVNGANDTIPFSANFTNCSVGSGVPYTYAWSFDGGLTYTAGAANTSMIFATGNHLVCLAFADVSGCTDTVCSGFNVNASGNISDQPIWYDCLNVAFGTNLPGTSCNDNNPATTNDTWSANCTCAGTICEPPVLTSPSGVLTICSSDSLVLQAITTGTGPLTYSWTGAGTFIPNNSSQTVYLHDAASGTYQVTVVNACGTSQADVQVTVVPAVDAGISLGISICDITVPTDMFLLLGGNPQTGGSWTYASQPHSSIFDPAVDTLGAYQYTILGTAPCSYSAASVFIGPVPTWFGDADGDGLGDLDVSLVSCIQPVGYVNNDADHCPLIYGTIGSVCDDGNPLTTYDLIDATCVCAGIDSSYVDCLNIPNGPNVPGTACTDPTGTTGIWSAGCVCIADTTTTGCQACYTTTQVAPFTALFTSCSTGGTAPFEIFWDFAPGGGVLGDSTTQVYPGPGTYIACLNILDANGNECHVCDSVIVDVDGTINPPSPQPCNAGFWVIQAYDSTASGPEPVPNEVWVWNLSSGTSPYQFFWNFGDGTSSSDPFPTHFYASGGPYTLCLTMSDASNCTATYCDSVSVDANGIYNGFAGEGNNNRSGFTINVLQQQPTAIHEEEDLNALELWPNPVNDAINISLISKRSSRIQLSVVDLNGRVVKSTSNAITNGNNRFSLPVNDLESGMYLLRISDDNNVISRRFVKQ